MATENQYKSVELIGDHDPFTKKNTPDLRYYVVKAERNDGQSPLYTVFLHNDGFTYAENGLYVAGKYIPEEQRFKLLRAEDAIQLQQTLLQQGTQNNPALKHIATHLQTIAKKDKYAYYEGPYHNYRNFFMPNSRMTNGQPHAKRLVNAHITVDENLQENPHLNREALLQAALGQTQTKKGTGMKVIEGLELVGKGSKYTTEITHVIDDYGKPTFIAVTKQEDKRGIARPYAIQTIGESRFEGLSSIEAQSIVAKLDESEATLPEFSKKVLTNPGLLRQMPKYAEIPEEHKKAILEVTNNYISPKARAEKERTASPQSTLETRPFTGAFTGDVVADDLIALNYTDKTGKKEMLVVSKTQRVGSDYYDYSYGYTVAEFDLETGVATMPKDHKLAIWLDRISEHDKNPEKNPAYTQLNYIKQSILKANSRHKKLSPNSTLSVRKEFNLPSPEIVKIEKQLEEQKKKSTLNAQDEKITIVGMNSNETHTAILAESTTNNGGNKIIIIPKKNAVNENSNQTYVVQPEGNYIINDEVTFVTIDENIISPLNPKGIIIHPLSKNNSNTTAEMTKWIDGIKAFVKETGLDEDKQNKIIENTVPPLTHAIRYETNPLSLAETTKLVDGLFKGDEIKPYKKAEFEGTYFIKQVFDNQGYSTVFRDSAHPNETVLANANFKTPSPHECSAAIYDHKTGQLHSISRNEMKARFDILKADLLSDPDFVQDNDASKALETITNMSKEGNPHYAPHNDMDSKTATNTLGVLKSLNIAYTHAPKAIMNEGEHIKSSIKSTFDISLGESCALQRKDMPGKTMLVLAPSRLQENDDIRIGIYDHKTGHMSKTSFEEVNEWQQIIEKDTEQHSDVQILRSISLHNKGEFNLKKMNMVGGTAADVMNKNGIPYEHFPKMMVDLSKTSVRPSPPPRKQQRTPAGVTYAKKELSPEQQTYYANAERQKQTPTTNRRHTSGAHDVAPRAQQASASSEPNGKSFIGCDNPRLIDGAGTFAFQNPKFPLKTLIIEDSYKATKIGIINHATYEFEEVTAKGMREWLNAVQNASRSEDHDVLANQLDAIEVLEEIVSDFNPRFITHPDANDALRVFRTLEKHGLESPKKSQITNMNGRQR